MGTEVKTEAEIIRRRRIYAFLIIGIMTLWSIWYLTTNILYTVIVAYMWIGLAYGVCLQWGRFCFASAWRDFIAVRVTRMAVGLMMAFVMLSISITIMEITGYSTFHAMPFGVHELVGGILFGIGMVLAGGCATGTLYKFGEGSFVSATALFGMVFGQALFVSQKVVIGTREISFDTVVYAYINKLSSFRIADLLQGSDAYRFLVGSVFLNTLVPVILFLVAVYILTTRKDLLSEKVAGGSGKLTFREELRGFWSMLAASKRTATAGLFIGIIAAINILIVGLYRIKFGLGSPVYGNYGYALSHLGFAEDVTASGRIFDPGYWYITSQETQFGGWILEKLGLNMRNNEFFGVANGIPNPLLNAMLWLSIGVVLGAMVIALLSNEFRWKIPNKELFILALVGGILMGLASRIALGCNIGALIIRIGGGDPGGWLFFIGMGIGAFISVKFTTWWTMRKLRAAGL